MNPETPLVILTALANFLLKVTFAFAIFWAFSRLINPPSRRYTLWLGFLAGAGTYWIWLTTRAVLKGALPAVNQQGASYAPSLGLRIWHLPQSWSSPLSIALGGAGALYLLVLVYFFMSNIRKQVHLRWVLGFACMPSKEVAELFESIAENLHVRNCKLLLLTGITSPATFGWIWPTVLLPTLWLDQNPAELEGVLRHELHHVRRKDFLLGRVAALFKALLFFHPAVWYAVKELQFERELACDLAVVSDSPSRRILYAECLVRFARLNIEREQKPWGVDFASPSVQLTARVRSILNGPKKSSKWLLCLRAASGIVILLVSLTVLPSLAVVLSYVQQQTVQPQEAALHIVQANGKTRTRTARRDKPPASSEPTEGTSKIGIADGLAGPITPLVLDPPKSAEVVYASRRPATSGEDTIGDSESSDSTSNSSGSVGGQLKPGIKQPTATSIIISAARNIPWGDHDHDHDDH